MGEALEAEAKLRAAADDMVARLRLEERLSSIGRPVRVGSSALGLMVRRDIDITTVCTQLDSATLAAITELGAALMRETESVEWVRFRNDAGDWNKEPEAYPDGYYLNITARQADGASWTFDLWFVDQPERQPDLRHLETLLPRLTDASRARILEIKAVLAPRPDHLRPASALVYEAVMDHGIDGIAGFEAWLAQRRT